MMPRKRCHFLGANKMPLRSLGRHGSLSITCPTAARKGHQSSGLLSLPSSRRRGGLAPVARRYLSPHAPVNRATRHRLPALAYAQHLLHCPDAHLAGRMKHRPQRDTKSDCRCAHGLLRAGWLPVSLSTSCLGTFGQASEVPRTPGGAK